MPRSFKLAILRARHDTTIAKVSDDACREFLIEASDRSAILQYWTDATMGGLTFEDTWLFPWVEIKNDPATDGARTQVAWAAVDATRAAGHDLDGYDGVLVLVPPGTKAVPQPDGSTKVVGFDLGANTFVRAGDKLHGKKLAVVHTNTDHTTICHELGHVVGYGHTHGLINNGVDWNGTGASSTEYGSPYDIMSSASFGSRWVGSVTWASAPQLARTDLATAIPGWAGAGSWNSMGPLPARAHVLLRESGALEAAGQVRTAVLDANATTASAVLWSVGLLQRDRLALLVVDDRRAGASKRYGIELRGAHGWDRGLELAGGDVARQAIVVHSLEGSGAGSYAHYRGGVIVPLEIDTDVAIPGTDLSLVVIGVAADRKSANVMVRAGVTRRVDLAGDTTVEERVVSSEPREVRVPHCGTQTFPWSTAHTRVSFVGTVTARGFAGQGPPERAPVKARWLVGGQTLDTPGVGTVAAVTTDGATVTLDYDVSDRAQSLSLRSPYSATPWRVEIKVGVAENDGTSLTWSTPYVLDEPGTTEGFDSSFGIAIQKCIPVEIRRFKLYEPGCWPEEVWRTINDPRVGPGGPGTIFGPGGIVGPRIDPIGPRIDPIGPRIDLPIDPRVTPADPRVTPVTPVEIPAEVAPRDRALDEAIRVRAERAVTSILGSLIRPTNRRG